MKFFLKVVPVFLIIFGFQNLVAGTTYELNQPSDTDMGIVLLSVTYEDNATILKMKCIKIDNQPTEVALSPDDSNGSFEIIDMDKKRHYKLLKSSGIAIMPQWDVIEKKGDSILFTLTFEKMGEHIFSLVERNGQEYDSWHFNTVNVDKKYTVEQKPLFKKSKNISVVTLNKKSYEAFINQKEKIVVVKYGATWCGACKDMEPKFKEASKSMQDKVAYALVDVDELAKESTELDISSIPTTILFEKGKEIARHVGSLNEEEILAWIWRYTR